MIPANVSTAVNANSAVNAGIMGVGMAFAEPTSAELAEFDQLLGDFNQPSLMALSTPALTLANQSQRLSMSNAEVQVTPEGLLSTLEQSAIMALPVVAPATEVNLGGMNQQAVIADLTSSIESNAPQIPASTTPAMTALVNPTATALLQPIVAVSTLENPSTTIQLVAESLSTVNTIPEQVQTSASVMAMSGKVLETGLMPTTPLVSAASLPVTQPTNLVMEKQGVVTLPFQNTSSVPATENSVLGETAASVSPAVSQASNPATKTDQSNLASGMTFVNPTSLMTSQPKVVTENQATTQVSQAMLTANQAAAEATKTSELTAAVSPILGDNKAVVFASVPSISVASSGVMQAASSGVEMPSTSQMLNSLATTIVANSTAGSNSGSTQQDQRQESSQSDRLMQSLEEAQSISDVELGADEFSLVSTTPLNQTASSSILSAPLNLRQPQWAQDVAQRVQVMINQSMNELEVRLDPLGLGPMKIGLKLDEQQKAHVTLSAQHGVTREMLENALPRLKELLAQEGIELASATVDSREKQTGNGQNSAQSSHQSASDLPEDAANTTVDMTVMPSSEHLVDQFA